MLNRAKIFGGWCKNIIKSITIQKTLGGKIASSPGPFSCGPEQKVSKTRKIEKVAL